MPRQLDPYSLQLFASVAREGSLARAAAKEHIAASALSRRMADLECVFGVPLFVRSPHGIELTSAGRLVHERAALFERGLDDLLRDVQSENGQVCGRVRLFANPSSVVGFLPERLRAFLANFPLVLVELHEVSTDQVLRACLDGAADVGVGAAAAAPGGLDSWRFADDPLIVVMPRNHELGKTETIHFKDVLAYPLVSVQQGGAMDRFIRERARIECLDMQVSVVVNSFDGVCRMVEVGLGVAIVPTSAASAYAGSAQFERHALHESWAPRELRLFSLRKSPQPSAVKALIDSLKD